jgi:acyl dehydratase
MTVRVGDSIPAFHIDRISSEKMKTVAAIFQDPTPFHWDRDSTRDLGFEGRLLNQSPINLGYVINMLTAWAGPESLRRVRAEFGEPVFDEIAVFAGGRVISIEATGDETIAECEVWLDRDDGVRSLTATAWVAIS